MSTQMLPIDGATIATEQHFTVQQVAEMWALSQHSVYRLFQDEEGVVKFSFPRLLKAQQKRKPRVSLRIPASVLARVHEQRARGFRVEGRRVAR